MDRANTLFDPYYGQPEFDHRLLVDEARDAEETMAGRTGRRICRDKALWSVFAWEEMRRDDKEPGLAVGPD